MGSVDFPLFNKMSGKEEEWGKVCEKLKLQFPKIVFLYNIPKVGSTSMVSSLRLYFALQMHVFHFHDFQPFHASIYPFQQESFWEFIDYLITKRGKQIYFIDIFREPIEHKMSFFFDHFQFHFPACSTYPPSIGQIQKRFLQTFPYLAKEDYFLQYYRLPMEVIPPLFPAPALQIVHQGVQFMKLRLRDAAQWGRLVETFLGFPGRGLRFFQDNATTNPTYRQFINEFRFPSSWLSRLSEMTQLTFYLNPTEQAAYFDKWRAQSTDTALTESWSPEEYRFYSLISHENYPIIQVDGKHYFDEGCICRACMIQRKNAINQLQQHPTTGPGPVIRHQEAKLALLKTQLTAVQRHHQMKKHRTESTNRFGRFVLKQ